MAIAYGHMRPADDAWSGSAADEAAETDVIALVQRVDNSTDFVQEVGAGAWRGRSEGCSGRGLGLEVGRRQGCTSAMNGCAAKRAKQHGPMPNTSLRRQALPCTLLTV